MQEDIPRRLSSFYHKQASMRANFTQDAFGWLRAESFADPNDEKNAVRRGVGLGDTSHLTKLSIQSNDVGETLSKIYGLETVLVQSRVLMNGPGNLKDVLCAIICKDEALLLMDASARKNVSELIDKNVSKPTVGDVTSIYAGAFLVGEKSRQVFRQLAELDLDTLDNLTVTHASLRHVPSMVLRTDLGELPGFQIYFERAYGEYVWDIIFGAGKSFGIIPVGTKALKLLGWTLG